MKKGARTIERVAGADFSVMLLGASGTGKEVIARGVHSSSSRTDAPFVAINCAAIPENLLVAELFGYEKGAFTGAIMTTEGTIELADGGTPFQIGRALCRERVCPYVLFLGFSVELNNIIHSNTLLFIILLTVLFLF